MGRLTESQQALLEALRRRDTERLLALVPAREPLPSDTLGPELVPTGEPWDPYGLVQAFALTCNGYDCMEHPRRLLLRAEAEIHAGRSIAHWDVDHLRAALFALQREYHDTWGAPEPALVQGLLEGIRDALQPSRARQRA